MESYKFTDGFKNFQDKYRKNEYNIPQAPKICVIACCDSRVDPALILDAKPGDLFVIRNVANLVPCFQDLKENLNRFHSVAAGLELAVKKHHVEAIVVLGHSKCGGIAHLFHQEKKKFEFIDSWIRILQDVRGQVNPNQTQEEQLVELEQLSIVHSLKNLQTYPWIIEKFNTGQITLHGIYFDFVKGKLLVYNPYLEKFFETNFDFF